MRNRCESQGVLYGIAAALPYMKAQKNGHIIDAPADCQRVVRSQHRLSADEEQHLASQLAAGRAAHQRLRDAMLSADEQAALREAIAVAEAAR